MFKFLRVLLLSSFALGAVIQDSASYKVASEFHHFLRHGQSAPARFLGYSYRGEQDLVELNRVYNKWLGENETSVWIKEIAQERGYSRLVPVTRKELPCFFSMIERSAGFREFREPVVLFPVSFSDKKKYQVIGASILGVNHNPVLTINPGLMACNDTIIGAILAHENGHWGLGHCVEGDLDKENRIIGSPRKKRNHSEEFEADEYACQMGYAYGMTRFLEHALFASDDKEHSSHPKPSKRIALIDEWVKKQNNIPLN